MYVCDDVTLCGEGSFKDWCLLSAEIVICSATCDLSELDNLEMPCGVLSIYVCYVVTLCWKGSFKSKEWVFAQS